MQQVALLETIASDRGTEIKLGDETLILVRDGDMVRAFEGKCPHAGAPLAKRAVCDGYIICPWHKAAFAVADGALAEPPALNGLASYRTEIRDDAVFVDTVKQPPPLAALVPDDRHVVILGAGAAGTACASALREFGFGGDITMIGAEPDAPYDRTALSKFVLESGKAPDEVAALRPDGFYAEHRIERVHGGIAALEPTHHRVSFTDERQLDYAVAVVATGGTPVSLDIPGADLDDEVIVEGVLGEQDFVALFVAGDKVAAVLACQRERATCLMPSRMRAGLTADQALEIIRSA